MIELLVALTVAGLVAAAALSVTLSSRELYDGDRGRMDLNQNLRIGLDLVGLDIRSAGQGLPADFPAVEIVDGGGTNPDTLILRWNLLRAVLPLCAQIDAGTAVDEIRVAWSSGGPPPGCRPVADSDADGWSDNVGEWRVHRTAAGGTASIYVFNPVSRLGEFVDFDGDGTTTDFLSASSSGNWQNTYGVNEQCRVYVLEQRSYRIDSGLLEYAVNDDTANPMRVLDAVVDFQVRARLSGGAVLDSFDSNDDWSDLESVDVTLSGEATVKLRTIRKTTSARFFPRQVLSL